MKNLRNMPGTIAFNYYNRVKSQENQIQRPMVSNEGDLDTQKKKLKRRRRKPKTVWGKDFIF